MLKKIGMMLVIICLALATLLIVSALSALTRYDNSHKASHVRYEEEAREQIRSDIYQRATNY